MAFRENQSPHHKVLLFNDLNVNNLVLLGSYHCINSDEKIQMHWHEGILEICYLDKGYQFYEVDSKEFHLKGGDVFITFPNEKHSSGHFLQERSIIYWFQINMSLVNGYFLTFQNEEAEAFIKKIFAIEKKNFYIHSEFKKLLDNLFSVGSEETSALQRIKIYSITTQILLSILEASSGELQENKSDEILKAIAYIKENIDEDISLESLADNIHLSLSHFKTKFKAETGTSPADYIQRQKIEKSKKLLNETTLSMIEIAYSLSYSSSQHFSTAFKKYTGKSPTEFKNNK